MKNLTSDIVRSIISSEPTGYFHISSVNTRTQSLRLIKDLFQEIGSREDYASVFVGFNEPPEILRRSIPMPENVALVPFDHFEKMALDTDRAYRRMGSGKKQITILGDIDMMVSYYGCDAIPYFHSDITKDRRNAGITFGSDRLPASAMKNIEELATEVVRFGGPAASN